MTYTKHVWKGGDRVTKKKMNNIEDGIAAADATATAAAEAASSAGGAEPLIIEEDNEGALDTKAKTIYDAFLAGQACIIKLRISLDGDYIYARIIYVETAGTGYVFAIPDEQDGMIVFVADTADSYPAIPSQSSGGEGGVS